MRGECSEKREILHFTFSFFSFKFASFFNFLEFWSRYCFWWKWGIHQWMWGMPFPTECWGQVLMIPWKKNFLRLAWEVKWFLFAWSYIPWFLKFHFPWTNLLRGAPLDSAELEQSQCSVSIPWWSWVQFRLVAVHCVESVSHMGECRSACPFNKRDRSPAHEREQERELICVGPYVSQIFPCF